MNVRWIKTNPGASRDEGSYLRSAEGRFNISPRFRHTIYPSHYEIRDRLTGKESSGDTIRELKLWANDTVAAELEKEST